MNVKKYPKQPKKSQAERAVTEVLGVKLYRAIVPPKNSTDTKTDMKTVVVF